MVVFSFYSQRLFECVEFFEEEKGYASITIIFSVLENIMEVSANDYDSSFYDIAKQPESKSVITNELLMKYNGIFQGMQFV